MRVNTTKYKQTELGLIPDDWDIKAIGEFTSVVAGGTPSTFIKEYWNGNIKWMNSGELNLKKVFEVENSITELGLNNSHTKILPKNCVLVGLAGQGKTRGTVAINKIPLCTNQSIAAIYPCDNLKTEYLYYNLDKRYLELRSLSTGDGGRGGLNLSIIKSLALPIPSIQEQIEIANTLNDIDNFIESLEKLIDKKQQLRQGALQKLLKPKKEWQQKAIGEVFTLLKTSSYSRAELNNDGYIGCIHYGDIHTKWNNLLDFDKESVPTINANQVNNYNYLKEGDIIMADASEDYSGVGKCVEVKNIKARKAISGLHTFLLRDKENEFIDGFKCYLLSSEFVKKQLDKLATGLKVYSISKGNLKSVLIPIPSKNEQINISTILFDMDNEIEQLEKKLSKYKQVKLGMMQNLLSGKIRLVETNNIEQPKPVKQVEQISKQQGHNKQFNEAVLIAAMVNRYATIQNPISRFRYTKLLYLFHRHIENKAEGFLKKAAGPYNPANRYKGPEGIILSRKYATIKGDKFYPNNNINEATNYFNKWYDEAALLWLDEFNKYKDEPLELLATVDMAVEDLKAEKKEINVVNVKNVIASNKEWKAKLGREIFSDSNIQRAINKSLSLFS